jgi:hypothetical protein
VDASNQMAMFKGPSPDIVTARGLRRTVSSLQDQDIWKKQRRRNGAGGVPPRRLVV